MNESQRPAAQRTLRAAIFDAAPRHRARSVPREAARVPSIGSGYRTSGDARGSAQRCTTRQSSRRTRQQYRPPRTRQPGEQRDVRAHVVAPVGHGHGGNRQDFAEVDRRFSRRRLQRTTCVPAPSTPRASNADGHRHQAEQADIGLRMRREACDRSRLTATRMPMPRYWPAITCHGRYDGSARKPSRTSSPSILVEAKARTARQIRNSAWLQTGKSENRNRYSLSRGSLLISIPRGGAVSADFGWTRIWTIRSKYPTPSRLNRIGAICSWDRLQPRAICGGRVVIALS